jgi:dienelactone hydrolase
VADVDLEAYPIVFQAERAGDRYGGVDNVVLESYRYVPSGSASDTVVVFMHPVGGLTYLPFLRDLARHGVPVISCGNRYRGSDATLLVENYAVDLHECIRHAKRKFGYRRIVLGGWSGGGAPAVFYQAEAEQPTVTEAPGGGGPNLVEAGLEPADALLLVAAHAGRPTVLREFIDPSVVDEDDLSVRDPSLDLYDPDNPEQPPYTASYIERYRAAQLARVRRITAWVRDRLSESADDRGFVVHNTMADPKWLDPSIDPNDRPPGTCFMGDPRRANDAPAGVARFSSLRSWLSQWSVDDSNADGPRCAARVTVPALVVTNSADDACTPSHSAALYDGFRHRDRAQVTIAGATHYYLGEDRGPMHTAARTVVGWLADHGLHQ